MTEGGRTRPYGQRELTYLAICRVLAVPLFVGLVAISGDEFTPEILAVIVFAIPYTVGHVLFARSKDWDLIDARWFIPFDLILIGVAVIASGGPNSEAPVVFYIWTVAMAVLYPPRIVIWCVAGATAAILLTSLPYALDGGEDLEATFTKTAIVAWIGVLTWCVADAFWRRENRLKELSTMRRRLLADALNAEERARRRLSESLQQDSLQVLISAGQDLDAGAAGRHPWIASRARERIRLAVRSLRDTVRSLHPAAVAQAGLAAAVDAVVEHAVAGKPITPDVRVDPEASGSHDGLVVSLSRELTASAVRDPEVRNLSVVVGRSGDWLEVELRDDGSAPSNRPIESDLEQGEIELAASRERVEAAGGKFSLGEAPEGGFRVTASLPLTGDSATNGNGAGGSRRSRRHTRQYGQREVVYFAIARVASVPVFATLNAVAGTPLDFQFLSVVIGALIYSVALLVSAAGPRWDRIDPRWFATSDLILLGLTITVTGGPESQIRAVYFVWPVALSMLLPPRLVLGFAAGAMASFALFSLPTVIGGPESDLRALGTFEISLLWITTVSWFVSTSFYNRAKSIERLSELRQKLLAEALNAEDRARRRLSQGLHDDALQVLLAAGQDLDVGLRGDDAMLERGREELRLAIRRLQDVIRGLDPAAIEHGGLAGGIDAVVEEWARRGSFVADVRVDPAASGTQDALVFSIVREMVSNAAKHSEAGAFTVEVARAGDDVQIEVADDGRGMEVQRPRTAIREGHIGLASCRERVEVAGGQMTVDSAPGAGMRVSITLPDPLRAEPIPPPESQPEPALA